MIFVRPTRNKWARGVVLLPEILVGRVSRSEKAVPRGLVDQPMPGRDHAGGWAEANCGSVLSQAHAVCQRVLGLDSRTAPSISLLVRPLQTQRHGSPKFIQD